jgi:FAD/FMN-containing dehydrogenase
MPLLNRLSVGAFNRAYRWANPERHGRTTHPLSFFYPLDGVRHWNRAYGPRGLRQFQCVLPHETGRDGVRALLAATHRHGDTSFLTVLKRFGALVSPGLLSFPRQGVTLTLDFPCRGARTGALLADLDAIALDAGGRINPYKDARMPAATFQRSFPDWERFAAHVDPGFASRFWQRVAG